MMCISGTIRPDYAQVTAFSRISEPLHVLFGVFQLVTDVVTAFILILTIGLIRI